MFQCHLGSCQLCPWHLLQTTLQLSNIECVVGMCVCVCTWYMMIVHTCVRVAVWRGPLNHAYILNQLILLNQHRQLFSQCFYTHTHCQRTVQTLPSYHPPTHHQLDKAVSSVNLWTKIPRECVRKTGRELVAVQQILHMHTQYNRQVINHLRYKYTLCLDTC